MTAPLNSPRTPPYKVAGLALTVVAAVFLALLYLQFQGHFSAKTQLTLLAPRSGLVMDAGSKVTLNGVQIGRVATVEAAEVDGLPMAKVTLDVNPKYIKSIPADVDAQIRATTVFGNKYVALRSPKNAARQRITSEDVITVSSVTTEFNTLFETVVSIAEKVDPMRCSAATTAIR